LYEHSAGQQALARVAIELACIERGNAGDPGIRRLRDDEIVAFMRGEQEVSGIVEDHVHARITQHPAVQLFQIRRRVNHGGLNFNAVNRCDIGESRDGCNGHAAAEANHQDARGMGMQKRAEIAEHALRAQVVSRGVDFSINAQGEIILRAQDGDGSVAPILRKQNIVSRSHFLRRHAARMQRVIEDSAKIGEIAAVEGSRECDEEKGDSQSKIHADHGGRILAAAEDEQEGKNDVDSRGDGDQAIRADLRQQKEPGERRARDGADGVGGIGAANSRRFAEWLFLRGGLATLGDQTRGQRKVESEADRCGQYGRNTGNRLREKNFSERRR